MAEEYERLRLEKIQRNKDLLVQLGLTTKLGAPDPAPKRKLKKKVKPERLRKSPRLVQKQRFNYNYSDVAQRERRILAIKKQRLLEIKRQDRVKKRIASSAFQFEGGIRKSKRLSKKVRVDYSSFDVPKLSDDEEQSNSTEEQNLPKQTVPEIPRRRETEDDSMSDYSPSDLDEEIMADATDHSDREELINKEPQQDHHLERTDFNHKQIQYISDEESEDGVVNGSNNRPPKYTSDSEENKLYQESNKSNSEENQAEEKYKAEKESNNKSDSEDNESDRESSIRNHEKEKVNKELSNISDSEEENPEEREPNKKLGSEEIKFGNKSELEHNSLDHKSNSDPVVENTPANKYDNNSYKEGYLKEKKIISRNDRF